MAGQTVRTYHVVCSSCGHPVSEKYEKPINITAYVQCADCLWTKYQRSKPVHRMEVEKEQHA